MKRIVADETWCLGCHLCEYNCAFANSGCKNIVTALKNHPVYPRVRVEEHPEQGTTVAVFCHQCEEPLCVKSCITGALTRQDGVIRTNTEKCVGCFTCVLVCPYGAIMPDASGKVVQKCELCLQNICGEPACVKGCPAHALRLEEGGE